MKGLFWFGGLLLMLLGVVLYQAERAEAIDTKIELLGTYFVAGSVTADTDTIRFPDDGTTVGFADNTVTKLKHPSFVWFSWKAAACSLWIYSKDAAGYRAAAPESTYARLILPSPTSAAMILLMPGSQNGIDSLIVFEGSTAGAYVQAAD